MADAPKPVAVDVDFERKRAPSWHDRVVGSSAMAQYTAFLDSFHSVKALRQLCSDEQTISALAKSGAKHMFPEGLYPQAMPMVQLYMDNRISRETLETVFRESYFTQYTQRGWTKEEAAKMTVDMIANCKKHGIAVHSFDHQDSLFTRGEYNGFRNYYSNLYLAMAHTLERNPQARSAAGDQMKAVMGTLEQQFRQAFPAQFDAMKASLAARETRLAEAKQRLLTDVDYRKDIATHMHQSGGLMKFKYDEIMDGKIDDQTATTLMAGHQAKLRMDADPVTAGRIAADAKTDRAAIVHGAAHFYRATGDVDHHLGEDKVTVIELYSGKNPSPNRLFTQKDEDAPNYKFDVDTATWTTKDGIGVKLEMPQGFAPAPEAPKTAPGAGPAPQ